jgi:DNA-binding NtrC family response regulator
MSTADVNDFHSRPRSKGRSILIIDDEAGIQTLLQQTLAGQGHYVRTAGTGRHALNLIRTKDSTW